MAREPRTIRALRARARSWPRAAAGAWRGRDDPRHHHAPVLEHGRKAAGCASVERKHLGRLSPVAARKQGGGNPGRFGRTALGGAGGRRCLSLFVSRFEIILVVHRLQPLVGGLLARNLQREMREPAVGRGSVPMLHPRGDVDRIAPGAVPVPAFPIPGKTLDQSQHAGSEVNAHSLMLQSNHQR